MIHFAPTYATSEAVMPGIGASRLSFIMDPAVADCARRSTPAACTENESEPVRERSDDQKRADREAGYVA